MMWLLILSIGSYMQASHRELGYRLSIDSPLSRSNSSIASPIFPCEQYMRQFDINMLEIPTEEKIRSSEAIFYGKYDLYKREIRSILKDLEDNHHALLEVKRRDFPYNKAVFLNRLEDIKQHCVCLVDVILRFENSKLPSIPKTGLSSPLYSDFLAVTRWRKIKEKVELFRQHIMDGLEQDLLRYRVLFGE